MAVSSPAPAAPAAPAAAPALALHFAQGGRTPPAWHLSWGAWQPRGGAERHHTLHMYSAHRSGWALWRTERLDRGYMENWGSKRRGWAPLGHTSRGALWTRTCTHRPRCTRAVGLALCSHGADVGFLEQQLLCARHPCSTSQGSVCLGLTSCTCTAGCREQLPAAPSNPPYPPPSWPHRVLWPWLCVMVTSCALCVPSAQR